jgi:hypothetical protein
MAKPNYQFEKRQRDLRKKQKQDAKRQRKLEAAKGMDAAPEAQPVKPADEVASGKPG